MITVTSKPDSYTSIVSGLSSVPVPVSACWKWCLQADAADGITVTGSKATVTVTFPAVPTVPANGTPFVIWGEPFTIQSASAYTGVSFKVESNGLLTALNFILMIQANYFFNRATVTTYAAVGATSQVTITWNDCREQAKFVAEQMVFTGLTATGATASYLNGVSPVYVDGHRLISRFGYYQDATSLFLPTSKMVGMETDRQCSTLGEVCPDYNAAVRGQLFTMLPALTTTSFIDRIDGGRSMMRVFGIEYGWVYRADCQAKTGTTKKSEYVLGINAAFDVDDEFGMRRYWPSHPLGFPPGQTIPDYLTTQPQRIELSWDSFKWLWITNNWSAAHGLHTLTAVFALYKKGVAGVFEFIETVIATNAAAYYQPINFNVSPGYVLANAPTLTELTLDYYTVTVRGQQTTGGLNVFNASQSLDFKPVHACDGMTDVYFLGPAGGIDTVIVVIQERELVREGQEIRLYTDCADTRENRAKYGGRSTVNLRTYERITFTVDLPNTQPANQWAKHLLQSPQHWIKVISQYDEDIELPGTPLAKKMLLDSSGVTIFRAGEGLRITATGYLADIQTQTGTEP